MTQLKIKNRIDSAQMGVLLGLLHSWNLKTEVMLESELRPVPKKREYSALSQARGMWADYDIDVKSNRAQTRSRRTKSLTL